MFKKQLQQGRSRRKTGGLASPGYIEDFLEVRTKLKDFFNILLVEQNVFGPTIRRILHAIEIGPDETKSGHAQFKILG